MEALKHRDRLPPEDRASVPVPVWLTLGSWDPTSHGLREWVTATVARDHPCLRAANFGADAIGQMLENGNIALFLDGLAEMAGGLRRQALDRIETEAARLRVTLTSRPDDYQDAVDTVQPLARAAVVEYPAYGYLTWIGNAHYLASGWAGQHVLVSPLHQAVVVLTGDPQFSFGPPPSDALLPGWTSALHLVNHHLLPPFDEPSGDT
jgi:hypothetical protein